MGDELGGAMGEAENEPLERVIARLKTLYASWGRETTVEDMRTGWEDFFAAAPEPDEYIEVSAGGVPARWIAASGSSDDRVVLFLHGGGFQIGSTRSHRALIAAISAESGARALGVDYRRAPEHRFPAALEDVLTAYGWLLDQGIEPGQIAFAGDSAGGNLALAAMLSLRDRDKPRPAAAVLLSPWTDLAATGGSYENRAARDPLNNRPMLLAVARNYLGASGDPRDPLASPLYADLTSLPPLLIQVGDREVVLDDARAFAEKARAVGVSVDLEIWDEMIHVFQLFPSELPEARRAIARIGAFLREHLA
ncbi:MAG: alpha/beta hydrolase [Alphaproteobacteria bacterium]